MCLKRADLFKHLPEKMPETCLKLFERPKTNPMLMSSAFGSRGKMPEACLKPAERPESNPIVCSSCLF